MVSCVFICYTCYSIVPCHRDDDFRTEIGELRSLIPTSVNIMALTATATIEVLKAGTEQLSLDNPTALD